MLRKYPLLLTLLCLLSLICPSLLAESIHYENRPIEKITVTMMDSKSCDDADSAVVLSKMKTKQGDYFSQVEFDNDLKNLAQDYDRVEPKIEARNDGVSLSLKVWPKPKIRSILWTGNDRLETRTLQKELDIATGSIFDRLAFNKGFHKVKAYYVKKGFFEAEVAYKVILDDCSNEVDIEITVNEGRSGKIKEIVFHNFTCDEEEEILNDMVTKKWNLFTSWLSGEGIYHEEAIQQDRYMALNYLQNEGYADAKVNIEVVEASSCDRIIIHISADKGEQYTIGKLTFSGNCLFTNQVIADMLTVSEGDLYSPDDLRETVNVLTSLYGSKGYIDTFVDYSPRLDRNRCAYSIHLTIEEGEQYRIGLIKIFGNCTTQSRVILHEVLFAPGEIFNLDRLKRTEEKLINIGFFSNVNVYAVKSDADYGCEGNYRDVHIEVEETSTGQFGASLGFSTTEGFFGGFNVTEKNFNFLGIPLLWERGYPAIRGGGEFAHIDITMGIKTRRYGFSWTKPFFMDTKWSVGFDLERSYDHTISSDYYVNASTFSLHAGYLINPFVRFGCHYRLTNSQTKVASNHHTIREASEDLKQEHASAQPVEEIKVGNEEEEKAAGIAIEKLAHEAYNGSLERQRMNDGLISAVGTTLSYDSRDNPMVPRCGLFSRLQMEIAGLGGDHSFFSVGYLNTAYYPFLKKGTLKGRADVKFIQPIWRASENDLPVNERFFLGGDDGIRGYRPYSIGPKFTNDNAPKGGISMLQLTAEYNYKLFSKADLFVFTDGGSLSSHNWRLLDDFKASVGFGIRLKVIPGAPAVTLGMGFPLIRRKGDEVQHFFFQMGARF
jgi:outer membrane protein insertion porin family